MPYPARVVATLAFLFNSVLTSVLVYVSVIPYPLRVVALSALLLTLSERAFVVSIVANF